MPSKPASSRSTMLTTPAMASEPYCAEAPSRSTSMRSIALTGIALRSVDTAPLPTVPPVLTQALAWRRLPLTSTSVWSGESPRSVAERMWVLPSGVVGCGKLNEGSSDCRILLTSV